MNTEIKIIKEQENGFELAQVYNPNEPLELWFVGKRVAEQLGYENTRDALNKYVDENEKNTVAIYDGNKGNPNTIIINESGLYSLIFNSKLPKSKLFKKWVTSVVLPSIRKNGGYILGQENMDANEIK